MSKQLEIFVKCFYVWTKIGLRTLSLAFFFGVGLDWIFILKYWTRLGVEKISVHSSLEDRGDHVAKLEPEFGYFCWSGVGVEFFVYVLELEPDSEI